MSMAAREASKQNAENFYLKFLLNGTKEVFVYRVSKEEQSEVSNWFRNHERRFNEPVISFTTLNGRVVNINPRYIRLCQELWDQGQLPPEKESDYDWIMYVDGIEEPLLNEEAYPEDIDLVASILECGEDEAHEFVAFTDEDGEQNWVLAGSIMLMESIDYREDYEEEEESPVVAIMEKKTKPKAIRAVNKNGH